MYSNITFIYNWSTLATYIILLYFLCCSVPAPARFVRTPDPRPIPVRIVFVFVFVLVFVFVFVFGGVLREGPSVAREKEQTRRASIDEGSTIEVQSGIQYRPAIEKPEIWPRLTF